MDEGDRTLGCCAIVTLGTHHDNDGILCNSWGTIFGHRLIVLVVLLYGHDTKHLAPLMAYLGAYIVKKMLQHADGLCNRQLAPV